MASIVRWFAQDCDLLLTMTERSPYTSTVNLTYLLPGADGEMQFPDLRVRVYHDCPPGRSAGVGPAPMHSPF